MNRRFNIDNSKVVIIPHSVDLKRTNLLSKLKLKEKERSSLIAKNRFNIFSTGRLEEQKDYQTLLKAFNIIAKKNESANLFILGDGEQMEELTDLTRLCMNMKKN